MEEYRPNSNRSREQEAQREQRAEKVTTGTVRQRQKTGLTQIRSVFLPGDVDNVKNYILMDLLVPSIKRTIHDIVCNGIDMLLGNAEQSRPSQPAARVSYRQYWQGERPKETRPKPQTTYSYDTLIFDNRGDAEQVLFRMEEMLEQYHTVSVADMFDLVGMSCDFTANKYGWTDLSTTRVVRAQDGYVLDLPKAVVL